MQIPGGLEGAILKPSSSRALYLLLRVCVRVRLAECDDEFLKRLRAQGTTPFVSYLNDWCVHADTFIEHIVHELLRLLGCGRRHGQPSLDLF